MKQTLYETRRVVLFFVIVLTLFVNCLVPSASMAPTINVGDRFITVRSVFCKTNYQDIISFKFPDDESTYFCKRVIGLPGDIVESKKGVIYINREKLNESYINETLKDDWIFYIPKKGDKVILKNGDAYINGYYVGDAELFSFFYCRNNIVKEDCYFCMGDNRTNSNDSRFWQNHFVKQSVIKSEFKYCYFSKNINHLGFVK